MSDQNVYYKNRFVFDEADRAKADFLRRNMPYSFAELTLSQRRNIAIDLSYCFGRLEGVTYTLEEAKKLFKYRQTPQRTYAEAERLMSIYRTFLSLSERINKKGAIPFDTAMVFAIHAMLNPRAPFVFKSDNIDVLSEYLDAPAYCSQEVLYWRLHNIIKGQERYSDPMERAVYIHCNLSAADIFISDTALTARMLESVALINGGLFPTYSNALDATELYEKATESFTKFGDYGPYKAYFFDCQFRHILTDDPDKNKRFRQEFAQL